MTWDRKARPGYAWPPGNIIGPGRDFQSKIEKKLLCDGRVQLNDDLNAAFKLYVVAVRTDHAGLGRAAARVRQSDAPHTDHSPARAAEQAVIAGEVAALHGSGRHVGRIGERRPASKTSRVKLRVDFFDFVT